jgi:branched-chain amino acid transport system substrate-binding protein
VAAGTAACGGGGQRAAGGPLTIYSSLPVEGGSRAQSEAVRAGERLALERFAPGGKLGKWRIRHVALDGSAARNARRAASDRTTILYLGEFGSAGSRASIPILNRAGIPQIGPSDTRVGLTTDEPGSEPGEPGTYRPTGTRTYARTVPRDTVQAAALVSAMKADGCRSATLRDDGTPYGAGLARSVKLSAARARLAIVAGRGADRDRACVLWSGATGGEGVRVLAAVAAACPACRLYATDAVTRAASGGPGRVPARLGARVTTALPTLGPEGLPRARPVVARLARRLRGREVDPSAVYAYEAMALALDVLERAGARANDRAAAVDELFETRSRASVLGTYSIDVNGDTSLRDFGLYTLADGRPTYRRRIVVDRGLIPTQRGR